MDFPLLFSEVNFLLWSSEIITFFPQLLNGPIIRPNEFFPQLQDKKFFKVKADQLAAGLTLISCGLFKKVVLADGILVMLIQPSTPLPKVQS